MYNTFTFHPENSPAAFTHMFPVLSSLSAPPFIEWYPKVMSAISRFKPKDIPSQVVLLVPQSLEDIKAPEPLLIA